MAVRAQRLSADRQLRGKCVPLDIQLCGKNGCINRYKRQRHARSRHAPLHLATNPANDICQRAEHFISISSTGEADSLPRSSNMMLQQCSAREAAGCNYLLRPTAATRARTVSRPLQLRRCTSVQVSMHTQWGSNHYFLPNCATAL